MTAKGEPVLRPLRASATPREREVLALLLGGFEDREIAALLSITPRTVWAHVSSLLDLYGARNRTQLVSFVLRKGEL